MRRFSFSKRRTNDLSPTYTLSAAMKDVGRPYLLKIYRAYGSSPSDGHTFCYFGSSVWADDVCQFLNEHCAKP